MNDTIYSDKIEALILMNLDGWCVEEETLDNNANEDYFLTDVNTCLLYTSDAAVDPLRAQLFVCLIRININSMTTIA